MPATIRWDRLSRYGLLVVFVVLLGLYVNPLRNFVSTLRESHRRAAQVDALERVNVKLRERKRALSDDGVLATEARKLGMTLPGERVYVVKNLPKGN
jgi:hypothetical protein